MTMVAIHTEEEYIRQKRVLTTNCSDLVHFLSVHQEDNISMRGIDIGIFQQEDPVHAILTKDRKLHAKANWPGKVLADDKIFLSLNLW
jgi:hypothetical protein